VTDEIEQAVAPLCAAVGLELVDVELRHKTLLVTVEDAAGRELDLERVAEVARAISTLLDEREELAPRAPFELEVSSPGVERRLRRPEHFRRATGSTVAVRTAPGTEGDRRFEAVLEQAEEDAARFRLPDGAERRLAYGEIERAHTVFDWRAALAAASKADQQIDEIDEAPEAGHDPAVGASAGHTQSGRTSRPTRERESR